MDDKTADIPSYQKEFYSWLYQSAKVSNWFDNQKFIDFLTFGHSSKMIRSCIDEIAVHSNVLQLGATFGNQIDEVATRLGVYGEFDLLDVNQKQLRRCRSKYCYKYPFMRFINQDAVIPLDKQYDVVICYLLLHELPEQSRSKVINNALKMVKPNGKVIFIDYNNLSSWHPLRYFVKLFNRLYQPFAESLWYKEIRSYSRNQEEFYWRKKTFFGKMYQKLVATKKAGLY